MSDGVLVLSNVSESSPLVYWSFGIAVVSLIWTVCWSYWTYVRASVKDYWFHQVVGPKTVEPILRFAEDWIRKCGALTHDPSDAICAINGFGKEKDKLLGTIWITKLIFPDVYDFACSVLDELEDGLATEVGRASSVAIGAKVGSPDFEGYCEKIQSAALKVLKRMAKSRLVV